MNITRILLSLKSITSHECTSNPDCFLQLMKFITGGKWGVIQDTDITTHGNLRSCNSLQHTKLLSDKAVRGSNLTKAKYNIINAELNNQNASHLPPTFSWETQGGKLVIWQGRVVNNISTTQTQSTIILSSLDLVPTVDPTQYVNNYDKIYISTLLTGFSLLRSLFSVWDIILMRLIAKWKGNMKLV